MAINTDFYGLPETWLELTSNSGCFKTGYTYGGNASYSGSLKAFQDSSATNPDNVASPPLDESIIPWKVNEKSDIFNRKYIYPYSDNYTSQQVSTWQYESSQATTVHNGGFRFFLQDSRSINNYNSNGLWSYRYSPLNTKNEMNEGVYRIIYPIVGFDYSKICVKCTLLYVSKTVIDDSSQYWSSSTTNSVVLSQLLDENAETWLSNNYVYGMNFEIVYNGIGSSHSLGMFAFDELQATPYAGGYYAYGRGYHHYQNPMTLMYDTGQMGRPCIGGVLGGNGSNWTNRWDSANHTDIVELYLHNYTETNIPKIVGGIEESGLLNSKTVSSSSSAQLRLFPRIFNSLGVSGILEYARKEMAYLGFRFSEYGNPTEEQIYLPEINSIGITTGNYKPIAEAEDYINYDWASDIYEKTPYDYTKDKSEDPNTYDDNTTVLNDLYTVIPQDFTTQYAVSYTTLQSLAAKFYEIVETNAFADRWTAQKLYVNSPIDAVLDCTFYPFDIVQGRYGPPSTVIQEAIYIGALDVDTIGKKMLSSSTILDFGKCSYYPIYGVNDFRSYPPYSHAELVIPYCGSVDIDPGTYLNHDISVKMIVDFKTGACCALIYRDDMVMQTLSGQMGVSIPISGIQSQQLAASERQAQATYAQAKTTQIATTAKFGLNLATGAMAGNPLAILSGTISGAEQHQRSSESLENAAFNLEHIQIPYKVIGAATATIETRKERQCRLIIHRPIMMAEYSAQAYGHNTGFATYDAAQLSNYSGLTVCANANTDGIAATVNERVMIREQLMKGIIL